MAKDTNDAIKIDDVEYKTADFSEAAKLFHAHVIDLDRKIGSAKFTLDQLLVNKDAFVLLLKQELQKEKPSAEPVVLSEA